MATNNAVNAGPIQHNVQVGGASGTLSNIAPSATSGVPVVSQGSSSDPVFGTATVPGGGTGLVSATAYAPIVGGTTSTAAFQSATTGIATSGFVLTSNGASAVPSWQASGSTITLEADTGGPLTDTSFTLAGSHGINTAGTGTTITFAIDNAIALGDLTPIASGSPALTASTGNVVLSSGNLVITNSLADGSSGLITLAGSGDTLLSTFGSNLFLGDGAGNLTLNDDSANFNLGQGALSLSSLTTGNSNCGLGKGSLSSVQSGSGNCSLGTDSGSTYVTESNNITISNLGTSSDSGAIRLGTNGTHTSFYAAGIDGVNVGSVAKVVTEASDQLGTATLTAGTNISITPGANTITIAAPSALTSISITGDTGGALSGSAFTFTGGSTGLSFGGSGTTQTLTFAGITANGGTVSLATDATTSTINVGTGAGVKTSTFGSTNTTSATTIQAGSGNISLNSPKTEVNNIINIPNTSSSSTGILQQNDVSLLHTYGLSGGVSLQNLFLGKNSGNFTLTSPDCQLNTGIGFGTLNLLTTASQNTALGAESSITISTSSQNCGIGVNALNALDTGSGKNVAVGVGAGASLVSGNTNLLLGFNAGSSYTSTESNNISIGSIGVISDSGVIRIGTNGTHTSTYIQGISGVTVATSVPVLIGTNGQMGTVLSSRRYKDNISDIVDESENIYKLRPVLFNYKKCPDEIAWGLIAEEVDEVFPDLVIYKDGSPETVKYHDLPILLLNELKKLNKRVIQLEMLLNKGA